MSKRLQNIINKINNGTRKNIHRLNLTREDLLTKDANGIYFIEYLLKNKIPLYSLKDKIEDDAEIIYLFCKHKQPLYMFNFNEEQLFSTINDKRLIEYIIEKNMLNDKIISAIKNNTEIIDLLIKNKEEYYLQYISIEMKNKLMTKNTDGSYLIEKYLNNEEALERLIRVIDDTNKLLDLCMKHNNYNLMKYANENVIMSKFNQNSTILEFLIKEKNITPKVLKSIPNNVDFINFLINNNYYDYLKNADENVLLFEISPSKTLLEFLIEKEYDPQIYVFNEKTISILYKYKKFDLIKNTSKNMLVESIVKLFQNNSLEDETLLEYLIDNNYEVKNMLQFNTNEDIIKILYRKQKIDLLSIADINLLLKPINSDSAYTYFDYILDNIKDKNLKININELSYSINDVNNYVKYYLIIARHDMMEYISELNKDKLLKKYNDITLLEALLNTDSELTLNKIIKKDVKSDPEIAFIIKSKGLEQKNFDISDEENDFTNEYLNGMRNHMGIGPLYKEGEELLIELQQLFLSDNKSDKNLINALISGYRQALFVNYDVNIEEIKRLIEIKKKNLNSFFYIKEKDSGYFSPSNGSIFCDSDVVNTILHETGHALHYYIAQEKVPSNYQEIIEKVRLNPETLIKVEEYSNKINEIKTKIIKLVEQKYEDFFKVYYDEDKIKEIRSILVKSKKEKKEEYKDLNIPEEQLDIILSEMYTEEEYINHQKRIYINENVDVIMREEFGDLMAIGDILDAIYEGSLHSNNLSNMQGEKIKSTPGHGIYYYYGTKHGFDEMIANFASLSKSNQSKKHLQLLKSIVGDEVYNMISNFYYQNIVQLNNLVVENNKIKGGK